MVTTTIVAGKVLMLNRQLQGIDEAKITAEAMRRAPAVWERYEKQALAAQKQFQKNDIID